MDHETGCRTGDWLPEIAELITNLNQTQIAAINEIVAKEPTEKWATVARRIGVGERQLRNIRNNTHVQEACYRITKALLKSDLPDVFKVLTRRAKAGHSWAVKLFLEICGEMRIATEADRPSRAEDDLSNIPIAELHQSLLRKLSQSHQ